jgi:ABC-type multidrug transport system fused ATPase/permease subunit
MSAVSEGGDGGLTTGRAEAGPGRAPGNGGPRRGLGRPFRNEWPEIDAQPRTNKEIINAFWGHVVKYKAALFRAFLAFFSASLMASMLPMATKFVLDYVLPSRDFVLLAITAMVVLLMHLLRNTINVLGGHLLLYTSLHVVFDVRKRLFQHLQLLHLAFYEREKSGKLVSKLITDAASLQTLIQQALPVLSVNFFTVVITMMFMLTLNVKLALMSLLVMPCYLIVNYFFRVRLYVRSRQVRERNSVVAGNINEVITGIKVVKSFGMQDQENRRFVHMIRENLDYEVDLGTVQILRSNVLGFIVGSAQAAVILIGGSAVMGQTGAMSVGDYVAFLGLMGMLFGPMQEIANLAIQYINARTGLERILNILSIKPKVVDRPNARQIEHIDGHVKLEDVRFRYETGPEVLHGINIEAMQGEVVALVGPSGSGKSTIVNLLTRFYDVTGGRILIDGNDLRDLQLRSYQQRVGIVLQEPFLFSGTIQDNISYGSEGASEEQVQEAARQANALDFISELPEGFDTQVGERGQLLSGGQRQRVSIARALLKDPDILILDEATSALDTQSEALVKQALDRLMAGRTVFVIAHRLSTIQNADKIVVLEKGNVVEMGRHEELVERGGLYSMLYAQTRALETAADEADQGGV